MLFNSIDFALFLPVVFFIYWFLTQKSLRLQNLFLVLASYLFYGWWDWRFLSLILFSTVVDYFVGLALGSEEKQSRRKSLLWISITVNLGFLGFFKYYNFFLENFVAAFTFFGAEISAGSLQVVLPVGISFYTFQTLSYTIDIYRGKMKPTKSFIDLAAFVSFFPQLVAGPIERATNLLPQFQKKRVFNATEATDGMRQILWGLFKKIVIADNCAVHANYIFANSSEMDGSMLLLGALFFTFQIYGDFSGYSDIAIGTARLFGFRLMRNFAFPYFSRDIAEFWRRWHISLSTWFRDYLYIPIGGSRGGTWMKVRNTFIIFIVSGFWHGANWTFIVWGALNALYFLPLLLTNRNRSNMEIVAQGGWIPSFKELVQMVITFWLTVLAWVFFRAESVTHAIEYLAGIFSSTFFTVPDLSGMRLILIFILLFMVFEWFGREREHALDYITSYSKPVRYIAYYLLIMFLFLFSGTQQEFIYFQF